MIIKKDGLKSIALCAVLFFVQLHCMDKSVVNPFLPKDIIDTRIRSRLALQDMSRFSRTCKTYSQMINLRSMSPEDPICDYLKTLPYDTLTRLLGHCEITQNKKMFNLVRSWHAEIRDQDETVFKKSYQKKKSLKVRKSYERCASVKYMHKQRLKQLCLALCMKKKWELALLTKILLKSSFNIFYSARDYRKRQIRLACDGFAIEQLIFNLCCYDNADLLLASLSGKIEPRAFKYVFKYASQDVIKDLHKRNAFVQEQSDKNGKNLNHYLTWHSSPELSDMRAEMDINRAMFGKPSYYHYKAL